MKYSHPANEFCLMQKSGSFLLQTQSPKTLYKCFDLSVGLPKIISVENIKISTDLLKNLN